MVLHFRWFLILRNWRGARSSPRGSFTGGGLQSRTRSGKDQASPFGDGGGSSNGRLTTRLGKTGTVQDVEHRCRIDGAREGSYAARWWKGWTHGLPQFSSKFWLKDHLFIGVSGRWSRARVGSISKLSNSMGIQFRSVSVEISVGDGALGSVCYPARGRRRPGPRPHTREARAGLARPVERVSAHGHILGLKPCLFSKLFFEFANYFEFN
jgi:hypothetical protein